MAISLHSATVLPFQQGLGALARLLDKAERFCAERGIAPEEIIEAKLAEDMLPFGYQVKSAAHHSIGAIEGVRKGEFAPDRSPWPTSFDTLRERVRSAHDALDAISPPEMESLEARDLRFSAGELRIDFTGESFLLSFSVPNFFFHLATAYDLLRMKGVEIGKRDFLGALRKKG